MNHFKIFPVGQTPDGRKIPLVDKWYERASSDPAQHQTWLEQFGERIKCWALPCGSVNGIYALDIDVKGGRNGFEYLKSQGIQIPNTAWQQTPSGGTHLLFRYDPNLGLKNTVNREIGIDGRSDQGFIYIYNIQNLENIQPIPEWVPRIVKKPVNQIDPTQTNAVVLDPTLAQKRFQDALTILANAQEGERNATLNKAAYLIGQLVAGGGVPYDYAYAEITRVAQSIGLEPFEIQATSLSGMKGGVSHPLVHPFGDTPPVPALRIEAPLPQAPEPLTRWTPELPTLQDLTDWSSLKQPQLFKDWSTLDIHLTSAVGGIGKTTIKLYEAVCLALGEPFLGFECLNPGRTLYITGEDSAKKLYAMLGRICKQIGLFEPGQEHRLHAVRSSIAVKLESDLSLVSFDQKLRNFVPNQEAIDKIRQAIEDLNPKQIVLDPIAIFGGSEAGGNDSAKAMMQAMHAIRKISDVSIDMISHVGKNSATAKDTGQFSARGATSIANHSRVVRTLLKLNANEYREIMGEELGEEQTAIQCFVSKFSDGSPLLDKPFMIIRDGYLFSRRDIPVNIPGHAVNMSNDKQRVWEFIRANQRDDRPLTEKVIADHFYLESPRILKAQTKAVISMLVFDQLIEIAPHMDATVGNYVRVR